MKNLKFINENRDRQESFLVGFSPNNNIITIYEGNTPINPQRLNTSFVL